jgi:hypothetical protein
LGIDTLREKVAQRLKLVRHNAEVRPPTPLFAAKQSSVNQHFQVMAYGGLTKPKRLLKVAYARLSARLGLDQAEKAKSSRVGNDLQRGGELFGV